MSFNFVESDLIQKLQHCQMFKAKRFLVGLG